MMLVPRISKRATAAAAFFALTGMLSAQPGPNTPLDGPPNNAARMPPPDYPVLYPPATAEEVVPVLVRVLDYLEKASPTQLVDAATNQPVTDPQKLPPRVAVERGDFQLQSYEWGVTYAGMLLAAENTGNTRFKEFVGRRLDTIRMLADHYRGLPAGERPQRNFMRPVLAPASLDDSGSMAAAMLKAQQAGVGGDLKPMIENYLTFISTKQKRFADGTLARDRPLPNSLWLDDLYMSVPALAQMGRFTGDVKYFDDAAKQILLFSQRMFVKEKGLYMHGWVEGMQDHPQFFWGRANGWAVIAMVELLSVLPENHKDRPAILAQLRDHVRGLASTMGKNGLWHQLLNRTDTYEETSASAMFVYAIARAINRGWVDALAYGPIVTLGWNAVAEQINAKGQVEGTCIGTGMGWEPMFYAYRPVSVLAAHGYGPVMLAGAEVIALRRGKGKEAVVHDGGVHFGRAIGGPGSGANAGGPGAGGPDSPR